MPELTELELLERDTERVRLKARVQYLEEQMLHYQRKIEDMQNTAQQLTEAARHFVWEWDTP